MPRLLSAPFFSANPVFRRAEYAAAVGRRPDDKVVTAMLAQHLQAGNIRRIARGVFASVPKHADAATWSVDRFLAASRLRQRSTIAYHSALELHGYAYTEGHDVQVIAEGDPACSRWRDLPAGSSGRRAALRPGWRAWRSTAWGRRSGCRRFERTIAICSTLRSGRGAEELFHSLDLVVRIDALGWSRYVARARQGHRRRAPRASGWRECTGDEGGLGVPNASLRARTLMPVQLDMLLAPGRARKDGQGWNVILPVDVVERRFEGL